MKNNIDEMTHEEILLLDREEIDRLVQYAMAVDGVLFLKMPDDPPKFDPNFDKSVYECKGVYFFCEAKAREYADWFNKSILEMCSLEYNWQQGSHYRYVKSIENGTEALVNKLQCYSPAAYDSLSTILKANSDRVELFKKDRATFDAENIKKKNIEEYIVKKWHGAQAKLRALDRNKSEYENYLRLANNDVVVAKAFFKKAYIGLNEDQYLEIFGN